MPSLLKWSDDAENDFYEALDWYADIGAITREKFKAAIRYSESQLLACPECYQVTVHPYRKYVMKDFPYLIFYKYLAAEGRIEIISLHHAKRQPGPLHGG